MQKRNGVSLIQEIKTLPLTWQWMKPCFIGIVRSSSRLSSVFMDGIRRHCLLGIFSMLKGNQHGSSRALWSWVCPQTNWRAGVLHDQELTYSVIVSEEHPEMPATVTEAYRVISEGILEGFKELGLDAYFAIPRTDKEKESLKNPRSSVCFDAPSWYELVVEGRKVAGSAQTRQKGVILQHGSILIDLDEDKLFDLFLYPNDRVRERMQRSFKNKAVAINEISDRTCTIDDARVAFKRGFEKGLNIELVPYELTDEELAFVHHLAKTKYASDEWNYKR